MLSCKKGNESDGKHEETELDEPVDLRNHELVIESIDLKDFFVDEILTSQIKLFNLKDENRKFVIRDAKPRINTI